MQKLTLYLQERFHIDIFISHMCKMHGCKLETQNGYNIQSCHISLGLKCTTLWMAIQSTSNSKRYYIPDMQMNVKIRYS